MGISIDQVDQVSKHYGSFRAVDGVSLEIESGSLVALLGPIGFWQIHPFTDHCGLGSARFRINFIDWS
jgi:ABC-type lipopolysaccharide export system ATPase subunit